METNSFLEDYPQLKERVILNVDDNEMNQLVISKILGNVGIITIAACNGDEAIKKLKEGLHPHVILMDLEMPVMNGIQTSEFIRKQIDAHVPIVINSGSITGYDKWKLKRLNVNDYLEKPYSMKDIFYKLAKSIDLMEVN